MAALGRGLRPRDRLARQQRPRLQHLQHPQAHEGGDQGGEEEPEEVEVLEQQPVTQHVGVRHARPRQGEPEDEADDQRGETLHVSASIRKLTAIAVPKNVAVATSEAGERIALPLKPLPDVHPPAVLAPNPISAPAAEQHRHDQPPRAAGEGVGQPAVAVEPGAEDPEDDPAEHQADQQPPAGVERDTARGHGLDRVGPRARGPEALVQEPSQSDHAEPDDRPAHVPRQLLVHRNQR